MGDPGAALALAQKILNGAGTIHVFSDFQKSNWEPIHELPAGVAAACSPVTTRPWTTWPSPPPAWFPPRRSRANRWRSSALFSTARPPARGNGAAGNGRIHPRNPSDGAAFGTAEAVFKLPFPGRGPVAGKLSLPPDDLPKIIPAIGRQGGHHRWKSCWCPMRRSPIGTAPGFI